VREGLHVVERSKPSISAWMANPAREVGAGSPARRLGSDAADIYAKKSMMTFEQSGRPTSRANSPGIVGAVELFASGAACRRVVRTSGEASSVRENHAAVGELRPQTSEREVTVTVRGAEASSSTEVRAQASAIASGHRARCGPGLKPILEHASLPADVRRHRGGAKNWDGPRLSGTTGASPAKRPENAR
jgi:hypothetical protein